MATTQYIGARYVPLFAEPIEWDKTKQYEPLTIVTHEGNSYTSRQFVPTGIEITNETFWALTGNFNAQVEQYRNEVKAYDGRITTAQDTADSAKAAATAAKTSADAATAAVAAEKTRAETKEADIQSLAETNETDIAHLDAQMAATTGSELLNKITEETNRAVSKEASLNESISSTALSVPSIGIIAYGTPGFTGGEVHLYISYDGKNFSDCGTVNDTSNNVLSGDTKNVFCDDNNLYLLVSGILYKATTDLRTFEKIDTIWNKFSNNGNLRYGVSGFYDKNSDKYYFYAAIGTAAGYNGDMQLYYFAVDDINAIPNTVTGIPIPISDFTNVIDPHVTEINGTYYLALKNENTTECYIATGSTPTSFTINKSIFTHAGRGFEAPQILKLGDSITVWVDGYAIRAKDPMHLDPSKDCMPYCRANGWFPLTTKALFNAINVSNASISNNDNPALRHPAFIVPNDVIKKLALNTQFNPIPPTSNTHLLTYRDSVNNWVENDTYVVCNAPMLIRLLGPKAMTFNYEQVFNGMESFYIEYASDSSVNIALNNNFAGGAASGRYLPTTNRKITHIIGGTHGYPSEFKYS